jgi:plastocyanin
MKRSARLGDELLRFMASITAPFAQHGLHKRVFAMPPQQGLEMPMTAFRMAAAAAFVLALAAPASADVVPTVTIALDSFKFTPSPIRLAAGQRVRMVFVNQSSSGHDFTARDFFKSAQILDGTAPEGEVELDGHQTAAVELIPARGSYKVHCSHFGHTLMGMSTEIIVS